MADTQYLIQCASLEKLSNAVRENTGASEQMTIDEMAEKLNTGVVPINKGGTGATDAATARNNLGITPANIGAAASSHTHSYLPLSGGTVTGLLKTQGGTMVHFADGTRGTNGYVNIAEIQLAGTGYQNTPIQLDVFRRGKSMVTRLYIGFANTISSDPELNWFGYEGAGNADDFYMHKSATSTWQLYIRKTEGYDSIGIAEYKTNFGYMSHKITFKNVQASSVPSGAIVCTYRDAARAESIEDAGDGRTLTFNYSAAGMNSAEWYAAWNGNQLQSIHRKKVGLESYPINSVYISYSTTSPASLFGGSWTQIKDCFLWVTSSAANIGKTGGSHTHTLSWNEMPSHSHRVGCDLDVIFNRAGQSWSVHDAGVNGAGGSVWTSSEGGNAAHNNMPPYMEVFAWRRTG